MNKHKLIELFEAKHKRMREIADACEKEKRKRNEAEDIEYGKLVQEAQILRMRIDAIDELPNIQRAALANAHIEMANARDNRYDVHITLQRDIMTTAGLANTGIIPVEEQEMLKPLRAGLIWDKLGINIQSGLRGTLRWPLHTKAEATWEDETSRLVDSSVQFSALTMEGARLGIAIPVSRTELFDSAGRVQSVITEEMPAACSDAINAAMFSLVKQTVVDNAVVDKKVVGPFAQKVASSNLTGGCDTVTLTVDSNGDFKAIRKELLGMIAKVYGAGVQKKAPAFVMNEATKVILQDTKVDSGSGRFVCEGDTILGVPAFTTNLIPDGVIGFGDWSYQAAGFFGDTEIVIDPYTLARQFSTDFVLNMRFGTATLRKDAFVLGLTPSAKTALIAAIGAATTVSD